MGLSRSTCPPGSFRLRKADRSDLQRLVELGQAFHAQERWGGLLTFDPESFQLTCEVLIERGVIFIAERSLIGLSLGPSIYNHALTVCSELFFWAPDGRGDELRKAAEVWASERACILVMSAHEPGPVERISNWYRRKGYAPIGRQFARKV